MYRKGERPGIPWQWNISKYPNFEALSWKSWRMQKEDARYV